MGRSKRQKIALSELSSTIASLVHSHGITRSALAHTLVQLKDVDLSAIDEFHETRHLVDLVAQARFSKLSIRHEFEYKSGSKSFTLVYADPNAFLSQLVAETGCHQSLYAAAFRRKRPSAENPWNLLVAFDELTAGNILRLCVNQRNIMCIYMSFLELGAAALSSVNAWVCPLVVRSSELKKIRGGFSAVLRVFLRCILFGEGSDAASGMLMHGVPLQLLGQDCLMFAKLTVLISDGEGHAMATDWRGANSFKPCFFCWNLLKRDSGITDPEFADVTETDTRRFKPTIRSNLYREFGDLLALKAQVDAGARGHSELECLEKSVGYSANPHGVLADRQLRRVVAIPTCQVFDWAHTFLQDGVLNLNTRLLIDACDRLGNDTGWEALNSFVSSNRSFPRKLKKITYLFPAMFGEDAGHMKLTCSELLTVYKVVRHFVETKCRDPRVSNEVRVFDIACEMVDIIVQLKANHIPVDEAHGRLAALEQLLMPAFGAAHGGDWIKPKIHWALHFS